MIDGWLRARVDGPLSRIAGVAGRAGFTPNVLTGAGFLLMAGAGLLCAGGRFVPAGFLVALSGACDALDGALARRQAGGTPFGAFLDSFLDRYGEIALFAGLLVWYAGSPARVFLVFAAATGALMVSYARARAEGAGIACRIGLCTRLERMVILIAALLSGFIVPGLAILAVLTHLTAVQRMVAVYRGGSR